MKLVFGTHNHLPLGEDPREAELIYQKAFKPLLSTLYCYPGFPATLHYSGILLDWLEENHPEFLTLLGEMVRRGQVEVLGGGYYDPILPMIPVNDRLGQLEKMTTLLRVRFETRPRGCWIAEHVWEPSLASVLRASGLDYTFVEEEQFRIAGVAEDDLWRPRIAEDQGKIIALFPVASRPSARAASGDPAEIIADLRRVSGISGSRVAVLLPDGASAGWSFGSGRLEDFLDLVLQNDGWLEPATPSQVLKENPPTARVYVPSSSSAAIMESSLPMSTREIYREERRRALGAGEAAQFVVGGHLRQFLNRCPEAWLMYSKMMHAHVLVNQVRGDRYKKRAAQNELWKGQCHYAYWPGEGRGIYGNSFRKAVYRSLIEAEKIIRATEIFAPSIISVDFDMDNGVEYLYQGSELEAYIHSVGGSLFELDFLPAAWNYLDTLASGDGEPACAGYQRRSFLDHFFEEGCTVEDFLAGRCREAGDFLSGTYELAELNRSLPELLLRRNGSVALAGGKWSIRIEKRFVFRPRSIDVYYSVGNAGAQTLATRFAVEMHVSLPDRTAECSRIFLLEEDRKTEIGTDAREITGVSGLLVRDVRNEVSITLSSAKGFRCWSVPIETEIPGRPGREAAFQSHCFVPQWEIALAPGETWVNHMSVGFERTPAA